MLDLRHSFGNDCSRRGIECKLPVRYGIEYSENLGTKVVDSIRHLTGISCN